MSGRVIVITGASAGVGGPRPGLRLPGHAVSLLARGQDGLAAAQAEVERAGSRALVVPLDVADAQAVEDAAGAVEAGLGPIAVWSTTP